MGEKWSEKNRVQEFLVLYYFSALKKNRVQEILGLCFFQTISPPCLGLCFFSELQNGKCSRYPSCNFLEPGFWILTKGG